MLPQEEQGRQLVPGDAGVSETLLTNHIAGQVPTQQRTARQTWGLGWEAQHVSPPRTLPDSASSLLSRKFKGAHHSTVLFGVAPTLLQGLCISAR